MERARAGYSSNKTLVWGSGQSPARANQPPPILRGVCRFTSRPQHPAHINVTVVRRRLLRLCVGTNDASAFSVSLAPFSKPAGSRPNSKQDAGRRRARRVDGAELSFNSRHRRPLFTRRLYIRKNQSQALPCCRDLKQQEPPSRPSAFKQTLSSNPSPKMLVTSFLSPWALLLLPVLYFVLPYLRNWSLLKIPGPPLAAFTNLWLLYQCRRGRRYQAVDDLHKKYGKVVRIQPHHVSIADVDAINAIYGHGNGFLKR